MSRHERKKATRWLGRPTNRLRALSLVLLYTCGTPHGYGKISPDNKRLWKLRKLDSLWIWWPPSFNRGLCPFSRVSNRGSRDNPNHGHIENTSRFSWKSGWRLSFPHRQEHGMLHTGVLFRESHRLQYQSRTHGNNPHGFSPLHFPRIIGSKDIIRHRTQTRWKRNRDRRGSNLSSRKQRGDRLGGKLPGLRYFLSTGGKSKNLLCRQTGQATGICRYICQWQDYRKFSFRTRSRMRIILEFQDKRAGTDTNAGRTILHEYWKRPQQSGNRVKRQNIRQREKQRSRNMERNAGTHTSRGWNRWR